MFDGRCRILVNRAEARAVSIAIWVLLITAVPDADERTSSGIVVTSKVQYLGSDNISSWSPNLTASCSTCKRHPASEDEYI